MNTLFKLIIATVSLGGLLFGFDMAVISGAVPLIKAHFNLTPGQEGMFVSSALVGCIIGVVFAGRWSDRLGRKSTLVIAGTLFLVSAIGCTFSPDFISLLTSRWVGGLGVGIASIVVPLYIAEISPSQYRGRTVTIYQLAITIGILAAYVSNALVLKYDLSIAAEHWRMMFLLGAIPAALLCLGLFIVPESPRWLIQKGKESMGYKILARLNINDPITPVAQEERQKVSLFSPVYRRAFILGLLLPLFSQLSGINAIVYFGPSILLQSGLSLDSSVQAQVFFGLANVIFTCVAIWKVDTWGRRPLYLTGTLGATISLLLTGWFLSQDIHMYGNLLIVSILCFLLFFAFSIGPLKFVVASEIFPAAIRAHAMAVSILVMWVADAIIGQLTPMLLDQWGTAWTFRLFAICCAIAFITVYYLLPETKGKRLEEIEAYWKSKIKK
ncbi:sugar porter family MFS transporter [Sphingobacterium spiritivorum]|uniref:sugar porter family MFS transporter n=1 Tax=Sphingobacterium spiritivorum TaxID=258 RepID=UPI003DA4078F